MTEHLRRAASRREKAAVIGKAALELGIPVSNLRQDVQLAEAVDHIVSNCGDEALDVLFAPSRPQSRQAVMKLSRTAADRQRYRVEGVRAGRLRSVAPQNADVHHVYDTVAFAEVPSRLRRARGAIQKLQRSRGSPHPAAVVAEARRLVRLCREAALLLGRFIDDRSPGAKAVPQELSKERVSPVLKCRDVRGRVAGDARLALVLTVKSVWDFPEMQLRDISPTDSERTCTLAELRTIVAAADAILAVLHVDVR